MITPQRVELDNKNKSTEVKLINRNNDATTTYRISFIHFKMTEDKVYDDYSSILVTCNMQQSQPNPFKLREQTVEMPEEIGRPILGQGEML